MSQPMLEPWRATFSDLVSPTESIIEEARNGRMFVLVDDESRENEGDLVIPAQMATPDAVNYLAEKGVTHLAIDSPSMGPTSGEWEGKPIAQMTHVSFLEKGGSWTEFVRNVGKLPARGAYYIATSAKIVDMSGGLSRALAIKPQGPGLGES